MKNLIVYYSYTGNTEKIAKMIQEKTGGTVLCLEPKQPFSTDYDQVVAEYQNNSIDKRRVEIKDINIDVKEYDRIFIGTPVWWYTICPVVTEFLYKYDLSEKEVYPFATNAGWLGRTFQDFSTLCKNSDVKKGENIVFESYSDKLVTPQREIENWIAQAIGEKHE